MNKKETKINKCSPNEHLQMAKQVNELHEKIELRSKTLIDTAIKIGSLLYKVRESSEHGKYIKWLEKNVNFNRQTAHKYIKLFEYKDRVANADSLSSAYKMLDTIAEKIKNTEIAKQEKRINDYKNTGKKSNDWKRGTDDKQVKEQSKKVIKTEPERKERVLYDKNEIERKLHNLDHTTTKINKEPEMKKTNDSDEEFDEILADYLDSFSNKFRKIIACQNIMKKCRTIIDDLS